MEKTVKLSMGECTVRSSTAREWNEQKSLSAQVAADINARFGRPADAKGKLQVMKLKSKAANEVYFDFVAGLIVKHGFDLQGKPLPEYLGDLSPGDMDKLENAIDELNKVGEEVVRDLPQQPQERKPRKSRKTASSLRTCGSQESSG